MTKTDIRNGAARFWGWIEKLALAGALAFAGYLFQSQQQLRGEQAVINNRLAVIETVQSDQRKGRADRIDLDREMLQRLSTLEAEMRQVRRGNEEIRRIIERAFAPR